MRIFHPLQWYNMVISPGGVDANKSETKALKGGKNVCVCVLLFVYVCSTAVPCCSPAVFPPENDGAFPTGMLLNHSDLITSKTQKTYT